MCCSYYAGYPKEFNCSTEEVMISFDWQSKCDVSFSVENKLFGNQERRKTRLNALKVKLVSINFAIKFYSSDLKNFLPNRIKNIAVFYNVLQ